MGHALGGRWGGGTERSRSPPDLSIKTSPGLCHYGYLPNPSPPLLATSVRPRQRCLGPQDPWPRVCQRYNGGGPLPHVMELPSCDRATRHRPTDETAPRRPRHPLWLLSLRAGLGGPVAGYFACSALPSPRQRDPKHPSESQGGEPPPRYPWIFLKLGHSSRKGKSGTGNSERPTAGWPSGTEPRCQGQPACRWGCRPHASRGRGAFFPGASSQTPRPVRPSPCGSQLPPTRLPAPALASTPRQMLGGLAGEPPGLFQIWLELLSIYTGAARVLNSPLAGWF